MRVLKLTVGLLLAGMLLYGNYGFSLKKSVISTRKNITHRPNCPVINIEHMAIENPTCGQSNGSITKIQIDQAGSKVFYTWRDNSNKVIGNSLDLTGIPAGVYTLEVSDNSGCRTPVPPVSVTVLNKNAVTIIGPPNIHPASCQNDGAITGLSVNGATSYQWRNIATGDTYSSTTTSDLVNVAPGSYALTAANATCSTTETYTISATFDLPKVTLVEYQHPTCKGSNGNINVGLSLNFGHPPIKYYWVGPDGVQFQEGLLFTTLLFTTTQVTNKTSGNYSLYVADASGSCPYLLGVFSLIDAIVKININTSVVINDNCNQHLGAIIPDVTGTTPPKPISQYQWTDLQTMKVVGNLKTLQRVGAGQYQLDVFDPKGCHADAIFTITNNSPAVTAPKADGTVLCLPGNVLIQVQNPDTAGVFKLYANLTDTIPIATNPQGVFSQHVSQTTDFYLTRKHGQCESERTKVTEVVVASVDIPNAFTPNHDGTNDYWKITGLEKFPGADVSVFNRSGALLFHSINYGTPFNGQYKEKDLPAGVYYYVIDVKQPICFGKIAGSLTIIR